jgi:hypothetical protein
MLNTSSGPLSIALIPIQHKRKSSFLEDNNDGDEFENEGELIQPIDIRERNLDQELEEVRMYVYIYIYIYIYTYIYVYIYVLIQPVDMGG